MSRILALPVPSDPFAMHLRVQEARLANPHLRVITPPKRLTRLQRQRASDEVMRSAAWNIHLRNVPVGTALWFTTTVHEWPDHMGQSCLQTVAPATCKSQALRLHRACVKAEPSLKGSREVNAITFAPGIAHIIN